MNHPFEKGPAVHHSLILVALIASLVLPFPAQAASVALATAPLANSTTTSVKPNLLLVFDNSGSMDWDHMPDDASDGGSAVNFVFGYYGLRSNQCNQAYYDPAITYQPPVYANGTSYPNASFTAAWTNGYSTGAGTVNLSTSFRASQSMNGDSINQPAYYYRYSGTQTTQTQKNYNVVGNTFYNECNNSTGGSGGAAAPASGVGGLFTKVAVSTTSGPGSTDERTNFANWYSYYRTRLLMMKTATGLAFSSLNENYRVGLMKISASTAPVLGVNAFTDTASTQRTDWYAALYNMTTSGSTPLRTALSDAGRYFAGKLGGTDPMQYSCQQNFTILSTDGYWNSGNSRKLDGSTVVDNQDGTAGRPMHDGAQTATTVTTTYTRNNYSASATKIGSTGSNCGSGKKRLRVTPETQSCSVTAPAAEVCTAWSGTMVYVAPYTSASSSCVASASVTTPSPNPTARVVSGTPVTAPGTVGGTSNNLADVAMYYYQTDLRTTALGNCTGSIGGVDVCENNVFISTSDSNTQQHMTTFTLGLGASGWMNYSSSYLSDTTGDYVSVKLGSTASSTVCTWQAAGTVCNWPIPGMSGSDGYIANIDDLWHAAVNGRGAYFSATNPTTLSAGLSTALQSVNSKKGAAAAAATSTLNPVAGNNFAYVASYTTVAWKGNLESRGINTETGAVSENASWCLENVAAGTCAAPGTVVAETSGDITIYNCVTPDSALVCSGTVIGTDCYVPVATTCTGTMNALVTSSTDSRTIKTANAAGNALINFDAAYATANPTYFDAAHIGTLSQWTTLDATQKTAAQGVNLLKFLRGQYGNEDRGTNALTDRLYRYREAVMGDALESQPVYLGKPVFGYTYPGYGTFKSTYANRASTVYMGANDGMMHAIASDTGIERWAYVPSMVIPNMWKLADTSYATLHTNYVNGSPVTSDVCTANCSDAATAAWKTILVGGLNGGGRGYYALDITIPTAPVLLWEFTPTTGIGAVQDDDIGYSFGQAIITQKTDHTWVVVVTSGYNNTSPGTGKGFLYVLNAGTGAIISKIPTGVGSTTTPSGLAKISGWNNEPAGNKVGYVYGGDLLGNLWRFDINSTAAATIGTGDAFKFATLLATDGTAQPITTTPVLGEILSKRYVFISTGKYLETGDLTTTQQQTFYSIKDDNATATLVNARSALVQQTLTNNPDGTATRTGSSNAVTNSSARGCYVNYPDTGERANIDSKLVQGIVVAPTIVPSNTACSPGGYGWLNYIDYKTCGATSVKSDSTIVGVNVIYIQGTPEVQYVTSTNPTPYKPPIQPPFLPPPANFTSKHVIWRELVP